MVNRPGAAGRAPGAAGTGGPLSVAVIDDDPSVRTALRRLLQATGHAVQTFASAEEFLRRPERDRPACLVLDVQLPGASGLDLMRSLAAAGCPPPVVFITGHADQAVAARALADDAADVLVKPFDGQSLVDAVSRAAARHPARAAGAGEADPDGPGRGAGA
jgi:FixJ family two-component response regulator